MQVGFDHLMAPTPDAEGKHVRVKIGDDFAVIGKSD